MIRTLLFLSAVGAFWSTISISSWIYIESRGILGKISISVQLTNTLKNTFVIFNDKIDFKFIKEQIDEKWLGKFKIFYTIGLVV